MILCDTSVAGAARTGACNVCRRARSPEPPPRLSAGRAQGRQDGVACCTWPGGL